LSAPDGLVGALEASAFAAWPAAQTETLDGWRLRFMHGVSRRANSVWPGAAVGLRSLDERVDRVEQWYAARGLRAAFQLSPASHPAALDAALAARGYAIDAPVSIQVASARVVAGGAPRVPVRAHAMRTEEWFDIAARRSRFANVVDVYRGLLDRIGAAARYAVADVGGEPAAVGLGVVGTALGEGCMGIFSMLTLPAGRRRGAAHAVLTALAARALQEGVDRLYLQVERDNAPALALYRGASFREAYGYHYRVRSP
jgi:ribosomal protein S18 acetylase RimI-like enzyme